jgi:hypothetical protein
VWQDCTRNEWKMTTPEMVIEIGVIGPFEEGYSRRPWATAPSIST